jgi:hypothetical protein
LKGILFWNLWPKSFENGYILSQSGLEKRTIFTSCHNSKNV